MFGGVKTEVEPFDPGFVGFEIFGARVKIQVNVFGDVAHDYYIHVSIIAHLGCRGGQKRCLRGFGR